jgi:hypothetical protein
VRLAAGARTLKLQSELTQRVHELEKALNEVKQLQGLLPICSYCKRIRDSENYWQQVEGYITTHSLARFSHSICPNCYDTMIAPQLKDLEIDTITVKRSVDRGPDSPSPS